MVVLHDQFYGVLSFAPRTSIARQLRFDLAFKEIFQKAEVDEENQLKSNQEKLLITKIVKAQKKMFNLPQEIVLEDNDPKIDEYRVLEFKPYEFAGFIKNVEKLRKLGKRIKPKRDDRYFWLGGTRFRVYYSTMSTFQNLSLPQQKKILVKCRAELAKKNVFKFDGIAKIKTDIADDEMSVWDPDFNLDNVLISSDSADEYSALIGNLNKFFFPPSRDKGHNKRNFSISSFNKLWQRERVTGIFKNLGKHFGFLKKKIKNLANNRRLRGWKSVAFGQEITFIKKFLYLYQYSLFTTVCRVFCCSHDIALAFIKNGIVFVNGQKVIDPYFIVPRLALIKVDIPNFILPIFDLLVWKLCKAKNDISFNSVYFSKFGYLSSTEISFKTAEILFLAMPLTSREFRKGLHDTSFLQDILVSQRYFSKQKKFGLGRLA